LVNGTTVTGVNYSAIGAISSVAVAVIAAVIAFAAWRTSVNSAKASVDAAKAAKALTAIERTRFHAEMRPDFNVGLSRYATNSSHLVLEVQLAGPPILGSLETVTVRLVKEVGQSKIGSIELRNPVTVRTRQFTERDAKVGDPGQSRTFSMELGDTELLVIEETTSGAADHQRLKPLRIIITCQRAGADPWTIPMVVMSPWTTSDSQDYDAMEGRRRERNLADGE
jgi:hypothetical protein